MRNRRTSRRINLAYASQTVVADNKITSTGDAGSGIASYEVRSGGLTISDNVIGGFSDGIETEWFDPPFGEAPVRVDGNRISYSDRGIVLGPNDARWRIIGNRFHHSMVNAIEVAGTGHLIQDNRSRISGGRAYLNSGTNNLFKDNHAIAECVFVGCE